MTGFIPQYFLFSIKLIEIYTSGNNAVFSSKGKVNVETWRCTSTLRGHSGDVLDMAWSPQDVWLATASVDNTVIIWDATKLPGKDLFSIKENLNTVCEKLLIGIFCYYYFKKS